MARYYTTRDFFRQMPNALLARYFESKGVLDEVEYASLKETKPDALFSAWLTLSDSQRHVMDSEFQTIYELSSEKGFRAILDEAEWHFEGRPEDRKAFVTRLAALSNHCERAFVTFLDYPQFWRGAALFHHADTLAYWRKRKNLPHQPAAVHDPDRQELADLIRTYFHHTEGRGKNCLVEAFRRGKLDYFFAYPEDYSSRVWNG